MAEHDITEIVARAVVTDLTAHDRGPEWEDMSDGNRAHARSVANSILSALTAAGYVVVPVKPTEVMSNEGWDAANAMVVSYGFCIGGEQNVWAAMVDAAVAPASPTHPDERREGAT